MHHMSNENRYQEKGTFLYTSFKELQDENIPSTLMSAVKSYFSPSSTKMPNSKKAII